MLEDLDRRKRRRRGKGRVPRPQEGHVQSLGSRRGCQFHRRQPLLKAGATGTWGVAEGWAGAQEGQTWTPGSPRSWSCSLQMTGPSPKCESRRQSSRVWLLFCHYCSWETRQEAWMDVEATGEVGPPGPREGRGTGQDSGLEGVDGNVLVRQNPQGFQQWLSNCSSCIENANSQARQSSFGLRKAGVWPTNLHPQVGGQGPCFEEQARKAAALHISKRRGSSKNLGLAYKRH